MKTKIALITALMAALFITALTGTENTIVKFGPSDGLEDSGISQPSRGHYEVGPMDWGTVIIRVPDNTNTVGNGNGTHLMILAGQPGHAVSRPGVDDANGGDVTIQGSDGVGTNGYGGSVSIRAGQASGSGVPGSVIFNAPLTYVNSEKTELVGELIIDAVTNQITFGATNNPPMDKNHVAAWISVQVSGDTNGYRLPIYK